MNVVSPGSLEALNIKDILQVIIDGNKVLTKQKLVNIVVERMGIVNEDVHRFKEKFKELIEKGMSNLWEENDELVPLGIYKGSLKKAASSEKDLNKFQSPTIAKKIVELINEGFGMLNDLRRIFWVTSPPNYELMRNLAMLRKATQEYPSLIGTQWVTLKRYVDLAKASHGSLVFERRITNKDASNNKREGNK